MVNCFFFFFRFAAGTLFFHFFSEIGDFSLPCTESVSNNRPPLFFDALFFRERGMKRKGKHLSYTLIKTPLSLFDPSLFLLALGTISSPFPSTFWKQLLSSIFIYESQSISSSERSSSSSPGGEEAAARPARAGWWWCGNPTAAAKGLWCGCGRWGGWPRGGGVWGGAAVKGEVCRVLLSGLERK